MPAGSPRASSAAAARALVMHRQRVAFQPEHVEIAAVALEVRPHLLVEYLVDLVESLAVRFGHLGHFRHARLLGEMRGLVVCRGRFPDGLRELAKSVCQSALPSWVTVIQ